MYADTTDLSDLASPVAQYDLHQPSCGQAELLDPFYQQTESRLDERRDVITEGHRFVQVPIRVFGGSSEGEGEGRPLPLERPLVYPYSIEGSYGGVV